MENKLLNFLTLDINTKKKYEFSTTILIVNFRDFDICRQNLNFKRL